jgi:hypothetical protein
MPRSAGALTLRLHCLPAQGGDDHKFDLHAHSLGAAHHFCKTTTWTKEI